MNWITRIRLHFKRSRVLKKIRQEGIRQFWLRNHDAALNLVNRHERVRTLHLRKTI